MNGEPYFADPRNVLRNAAKPLQDLGLTAVAATELEFYLLEADADVPTRKVGRIPGTRKTQDGPQYAIMEDVEDADDFLAELYATCAAQNIPVGATLKEFSPGQFEVNLHHVANAEQACDHAVLLKRAVKAVARRHGMAASFMAKPFSDSAGCSLHVHVSLVDKSGKNVFAGDPYSDTFRHAVGGLAAAMPESMAIFAPTANSYRRYKPGMFVPMAPLWGLNHRGVALRVPLSGPEDTRIEHRPGGSDGNPYLVMAVGKRYHDLYATCRREECDRFHAEISDRDYEWYLRAV
jgi:glutamine synthetase